MNKIRVPRMNWKITFIRLLAVCFMVSSSPAGAASVSLQETGLYEGGSAAGVYSWGDDSLFVVDDQTELWKIDPQTGEYLDYYPLGGDNLADIDLAQNNQLWWADNAVRFGTLDLITQDTRTWMIDIQDYGSEPLQLGPVLSSGNQVWLASWYGTTYGLFRFEPVSKSLCLYPFPSGLFAADLIEQSGLLWMLDWNADNLLSMDTANGHLVKYPIGRDVREHANLDGDGNRIWWAEDTVNGAIVSMDPHNGERITYTLPPGAHPRSLALRNGEVWYTDVGGYFGRLDPLEVSTQSVGVVPQVVAETITADCSTLEAPYEQEASFYTGTFDWSNASSTVDASQAGLEIYGMPDEAAPYGVNITSDVLWVSDPGRQKLVRMKIIDEYNVFLPAIIR